MFALSFNSIINIDAGLPFCLINGVFASLDLLEEMEIDNLEFVRCFKFLRAQQEIRAVLSHDGGAVIRTTMNSSDDESKATTPDTIKAPSYEWNAWCNHPETSSLAKSYFRILILDIK